MNAAPHMIDGHFATRAASVQRAFEDGRGGRRLGDAARRRSIVAAVAAIRHRADATAQIVDATYQRRAGSAAGTCLAAPSEQKAAGLRLTTATQTGRTKEVSNETSARPALTAHQTSEIPGRG